MEAGAKTKRETAVFSDLRRKYGRYMPLYVMMLPGILYLVINNYLPMAGITLAFKQVDYRVGILKSPWVGFSNFEFLFRSTDAFVITRNTLLYNGVFLLLGPVLGITVAIVLSEIRSKMAKKVYQTIVLIPYLISIVVVSYLVYAFLATDAGFINNSILKPLGIEGVRWYSTKKYWPFILVIVHFWQDIGYSTIIYYSTVVGLDPTLYEAAAIDGAGRWKQILCVTLPGLKSTIITLTLLRVGKIFYSDFGLFYQVPMNSGPLYDVTNTIDTYVYRGLMQLSNIGMSSAAGFYQSVVGFLFVLTANLIVRKISKEDALF
ncbi:ABC transporter permease subunit [Enterocloster citroniae]|uniref:ABC transporter permease n=1 Tax=Enterocloster citroniae TaxID=358743 RepID=UPI001D08FA57|nr:ABC transporter permease subunit [Enterocloster citroniae]MCB7065418.1 ABC transporter permease subunit [Enterocloster citroniae]